MADKEKQPIKPENQEKKEDQQNIDIFQIGDEQDKPKKEYILLQKIIDNNIFNILINVFTIFALFGDDIRVMAFRQPADIVFDVLTIIALVLFLIEIVIAFVTRPLYRWSFFFWLDAISTISLLLDIQLITTSLFLGGKSAKTAKLARAGRASRVGTKAGRVVRLVRLIRIVKLYQAASDEKGQKEKKITQFQKKMQALKQQRYKQQATVNEISNNAIGGNNKGGFQSNTDRKKSVTGNMIPQPTSPTNEITEAVENDEQKEFKESRVSKKLSDLTTKRVIIIVLLLLFIMPLYSADYYFDPPQSLDFGVYLLKSMSEYKQFYQSDFNDLFQDIINQHEGLMTPVARLSAPFNGLDQIVEQYIETDYDLLREDEQDFSGADFDYELFYKNSQGKEEMKVLVDAMKSLFKTLDTEDIQFLAILNNRQIAIQNSGLGLGRTLFVCVVLTVGALMFSKDANDLALRPIERMIDKVNQIAQNPISAKEQKLRKDQGQDEYETTLIENAIIKIGTLLALGFGDAGSEIIALNMSQSGDVNPMIPGKKLLAIYGFCDIRNFTDATEVLQEEVMLFVNNIGEIVHRMVDRFLGGANKNIGDAFLLVWKIPQEMYKINNDNTVDYIDSQRISLYADLSILSFMKIQAKINRQLKVLQYRKDHRLQARMPNYQVKMGFGLHMGWSIEGAIGSEFQIDASYLSPSVNMASRLEGATKAYGVPLLISGDTYDRFTPSMKYYVRQIDIVEVKGFNYPIGMYTVDMNLGDLPPSKDPDSEKLTPYQRRIYENEKQAEIINGVSESTFSAQEFVKQNKDLQLVMSQFNKTWQDLFASGFTQYQNGQWKKAKEIFEKCLEQIPDDGPSKALIQFMEEEHMQPPQDWKGCRPMPDH